MQHCYIPVYQQGFVCVPTDAKQPGKLSGKKQSLDHLLTHKSSWQIHFLQFSGLTIYPCQNHPLQQQYGGTRTQSYGDQSPLQNISSALNNHYRQAASIWLRNNYQQITGNSHIKNNDAYYHPITHTQSAKTIICIHKLQLYLSFSEHTLDDSNANVRYSLTFSFLSDPLHQF